MFVLDDMDRERTLMARELPGSSSNLYSASGSSTHSLVLEVLESLMDIESDRDQNHSDRKQTCRAEISLFFLTD